MSRTSPPESTTIGQVVGEFRALGVSVPLPWTTPEVARAQAGKLVAQLGPHHQEIVKNPHRDAEWARAAVCSAALLGAVHAVIGPDVAVENTFLVVKWPGSDFEIPWHQDGIDRRIELDPDRSVSAWLAVTDAAVPPGTRSSACPRPPDPDAAETIPRLRHATPHWTPNNLTMPSTVLEDGILGAGMTWQPEPLQ